MTLRAVAGDSGGGGSGVPSVSTPNIIYGTNASGTNTTYPLYQAPTSSSAGSFTANDATSSVVLFNATAANIAVSLNNGGTSPGKTITFKKMDASANTVTLTPTTGNVDGGADWVLSSQYQWVTLVFNGPDWVVISTGPNLP